MAWALLAASSFIVTAVLYRQVGAAAFGLWATVAALRGIALFLEGGLMFGATGAAARHASEPDESRLAVQAQVALGVVSGAIVLCFAIAFAWLPGAILGVSAPDAATASTLMLIMGLEAGIALATAPILGVARGVERFDALAAGAAIQSAVSVALVLTLTPTLGVVGAAIGLLVGRTAGLIPVLLVASRVMPPLLSLGWPARRIRSSLVFTVPMWLMAIGSQIGLGTDVPVVGAFFGATAAGSYAVGAVVPATALALLYALTDAAYPRVVRRRSSGADIVSRIIAVSTLLAGLGFTVMFVFAPSILAVWIGAADALAVDVLRIYCVAWALNVPAHALALHAMASSTHVQLVPIVLGEAAISLAIGIALAAGGLATGPAIATLVTLAISNLIVVPWLTLPRVGIRSTAFVSSVAISYLAGVAGGAFVGFVVTRLGLADLAALVIAGIATVGLGSILLMAVTPAPSHIDRIGTMIRHGGIRTWFRQRQQVRSARVEIDRSRRESPVLWLRAPLPLVTVRIATYNRGEIVRDRAIASALAQTYPNIEVVVVGDRCDAATEAAVRSVRDSRVRFENLPQRGNYPANPRYRWMVAGTAPMNRALELARGDWIAPLDDDDEFSADHVEVLLDACRTRDLEMAYGIAEMETEPGSWHRVGSAPLRHGHIVHAAVLFWRHAATIRHDIDSWRLGEPGDWNVWHRMRDAGVRMGFVDHVVTRHYLERREIR